MVPHSRRVGAVGVIKTRMQSLVQLYIRRGVQPALLEQPQRPLLQLVRASCITLTSRVSSQCVELAEALHLRV